MDPAYGGAGGGSTRDNSSNNSSVSFVNPLASMISMMQQQQQQQGQGQSSPGMADVDQRGQQQQSSKAPAKITMNIPSFFPKIQNAPQSQTSPVQKKQQQQQEDTTGRSQSHPHQSQNVQLRDSRVHLVNVKDILSNTSSSQSSSGSSSSVSIPKLSPVHSSNVSVSNTTNSSNPRGGGGGGISAGISNTNITRPTTSSSNPSQDQSSNKQQHSSISNNPVRQQQYRPGPASSRNLQLQQQVASSPTLTATRLPKPAPNQQTSLRSQTPTTLIRTPQQSSSSYHGQQQVNSKVTSTVIIQQHSHSGHSQSLHKKPPSSSKQQQPVIELDPLAITGDPLATDEAEEGIGDPFNLQKCDVPGCSHVKSSVISLFSIPPHGLASWCQTLKIDLSRLNSLEIDSLKICSEHFDLSQFVEGSACKELKTTAVPRPSAFAISKMATKQTASSEDPGVLKFVPVPVSISAVEKPLSFLSPDVTIQRTTVSVENPTQLPPLQPQTPSQLIRPGAPTTATNVSSSESSPLSYPPPSKVQIMTVPTPTQPEISTVTSITPSFSLQLETSSLSSTGIPRNNLVSMSMTSVAQQVGLRKPGPGNGGRGPRGRPRKYPVNVTVSNTSNPNISTPRTQLANSPAAATASSLVAAKKSSNLEQVNPLLARVAVGSYCRPTIKVKSENVKIDELANLVMPSEDWSVNVYPSLNKDSKNQICTISETILNSDMVEIVKKSITVHSNWAMKFSIFSKDMSHFNLGLGVTDMSDLQAVLDNFHALPCCKGLSDILNNKNISTLSLQMKVLVERFVDNVFRSVNCPLLIVKPESCKMEGSKFDDSCCMHCHNISQNLSFLKPQ